jgi:hypothetical protein
VKTLQIYLADMKELLEARDFVSARTLLKEISPIDLADGWDHFDADERVASTRQKDAALEELERATSGCLSAASPAGTRRSCSATRPSARRMMCELPSLAPVQRDHEEGR